MKIRSESSFYNKICLLIIITYINLNILKCKYDDNSKKLSIAIIGANMGGVSLAHYLNKKFDGDVNITIFDKDSRYGGSIRTETEGEKNFEYGTYYEIPDWFKNIKQLIKEFGLNLVPANDKNHRTGFFDGKDITLNTLTNNIHRSLNAKYLEDSYIVSEILKKFQKDFEKVYEITNKSPKKSIDELLSASGLHRVLFMTRTDEFLNNNNVKLSTVDQLYKTIIHSTGYMDTSSHIYSSLRNIFSFLSAKFKVKEGLSLLIKEMLFNKKHYNQNTFLKLNSEVVKVKYLKEEKKFVIFYKNLNGKIKEIKFDKIVFANLLSKDTKILFEDVDQLDNLNNKNFLGFEKINKIYSNVFIGNLNKSTLGYSPNSMNHDDLPDNILFNNLHGNYSIKYIQTLCKNCYENRNYEASGYVKNSMIRIISSSDLSKNKINDEAKNILMNGSILKNEYTTSKSIIKNFLIENEEEILDIVLNKNGLYYLKSYEYLNPNMEYSTIFANNIANLIYEDYSSMKADKDKDYFEIDL